MPRIGPQTILSSDKEKYIIEWVEEMARIGCGKTKSEILLTVKQILDLAGKTKFGGSNMPGKSWWNGFLARHPDMQLVRPYQLEVRQNLCISQK